MGTVLAWVGKSYTVPVPVVNPNTDCHNVHGMTNVTVSNCALELVMQHRVSHSQDRISEGLVTCERFGTIFTGPRPWYATNKRFAGITPSSHGPVICLCAEISHEELISNTLE